MAPKPKAKPASVVAGSRRRSRRVVELVDRTLTPSPLVLKAECQVVKVVLKAECQVVEVVVKAECQLVKEECQLVVG